MYTGVYVCLANWNGYDLFHNASPISSYVPYHGCDELCYKAQVPLIAGKYE